MARDDWRDRDDYGQADYSRGYGYDPRRRAGYEAERRYGEGREDRSVEADRDYARRMNDRDDRRSEPRSWLDRAEAFFSGEHRADDPGDWRRRRRRGPSDRVIRAVILERLDDARLDVRDVDVIVEDQEVTLNGTVRRKADKREIEDIADIEGVRHVQNNLRVREGGHWVFI